MLNKFFSIITSLSIIIAPAIVNAGGICRTGLCNQHIVRKQVVHRDDFVIRQKVVEFDADYFLGINQHGGGGYYDVVNQIRSEDLAKDKDIILKQSQQLDKVLEVLQAFVELEKNKGHGNEECPPDEPKPEPEPKDPMPEPEEPEEPNPEPSPDDDLTAQVYKIFENNCASCHGPDQQSKGLQLIGEDENGKWVNDLSLEDRVAVHDVTYGVGLKERGKKLMPLGGPALPTEDVETLRLWMVKKAEDIKESYKRDNNE